MSKYPYVNVVQGDSVEIVVGPLDHQWIVISHHRAEELAYDLQEAAIEASHYGDEPTETQMEAMNNPDSGPSDSHYRQSLRDSGRGHLVV